MTPSEFISLQYEHLLTSTKNITRGSKLSEDLLHDAILVFYEKPNVQDIVDSGGATFYIVRILLNQFRSNTSSFNSTYRKRFEELNDRKYVFACNEEEECSEKNAKIAAEAIEELDWYSKKLFSVYREHNCNVSSVSRSTKIPNASIFRTLRKLRLHVQEKINKKENE